jgi:hypothetical protein
MLPMLLTPTTTKMRRPMTKKIDPNRRRNRRGREVGRRRLFGKKKSKEKIVGYAYKQEDKRLKQEIKIRKKRAPSIPYVPKRCGGRVGGELEDPYPYILFKVFVKADLTNNSYLLPAINT